MLDHRSNPSEAFYHFSQGNLISIKKDREKKNKDLLEIVVRTVFLKELLRPFFCLKNRKPLNGFQINFK